MTLTLIYAITLSVLTFSLYISLAIIINDKDTLGEVCFIVCSISYISPTQLLIKVLNKKDYKIIPIFSAIISALGFGSWTIFGLFQFSATIIIPNLVGFIFSAAQIIIYRLYKNKKALVEEIGNISTSVIGAVKNVVERTVEIANNINQTTQNDNQENGENPSNKTKNANSNINFDTNKENNQTQSNEINKNNNYSLGDFDFNTNIDVNPQNNGNNNNNIQNNPDINKI
jgi:hypothetical protein